MATDWSGVLYAERMEGTKIIYVGDPLCSWCWGIAPELERITSLTSLPMDVVVGGLRPGPSADPMSPRMEAFLAEHWRHVEERSGQPFDHSILTDHSWSYDTEPACTAVVTMRRNNPTEARRFFTRIQRAFYAEGFRVFEPSDFRPLLDGFDVDEATFMEDLVSAEVLKETWGDFSWARAVGVNAFPVVILEQATGLRALARGYATADEMFQRLVSSLPAEAASAVCEVGEPC